MSKPFIQLPELTLKALFEYSTNTYGDRPAVQFVDGNVMTYEALKAKVSKIQEILYAYDIRPGDRVALYSENMPNWSAIYFAVVSMGAVIVPILPDFHTSEAMHIAHHAECKAAFISQKLFETLLDEKQPPDMCLLVIADKLNILTKLSTPSKMDTMLKKGGEQFTKAMERLGKEKKEKEEHIIKEDDLAAIIYTSGTTGSSKGVMLTHRNITFDATAAQHVVDIFPEDRFLSVLPLAHTFECTVGMIIPLLNGASIYYIQKPPTPTILVKALAKVRPTFMLSVPLIIEKIYKNRIQPNFEKNFLIKTLYAIPPIRKLLNRVAGKKLMETFGGEMRFFGIGGAGLSPLVEKFLREANFPYCIGYGLTETSPFLAGTNPEKTKYKAIGPVVPGVEIELRDENAEGIGTLWAKGPIVMKGYYKDPEKTAEVMDENGWFNTEDIGYIDSDGYFFMSGRAKNIIVGPSGENIYPEQIEAFINANSFVADSLVFDDNGILSARINLDYDKLDEELGVKKKSETEVHKEVANVLEEIRKEVNEKVSSFSRLRRVIEQKEPFVKTPTKKIKRYLYV
ncbi:AMP-binding protein [Sulfurovum lithotrophicum]|uniref:AMP-binding protein n=1 Tax=Sulfurovum lithotrophicum TaxID=206403 RepID=A0A7U4M104_9BACT|nr:AMP-binding protein [Sulfurovum lithotrophicum]AKF24845.1 AMP-binding protein [Sulfurovum lithotrophicum]